MSEPLRGTRLLVAPGQRGFVDDHGRPFFYLGDTAWTLFKRLDRADADRYLTDRAAKGFTVIQAYVLRGLEVTNLEGHLPLVDRDPTRLNEGFFGHVDWIVRRANELGLAMGLVATMGEHVKRRPGSERFKERDEQVFDVQNAHRFGELLGARYRDDCVLWLLGGDRNPSDEDIAVWDSMAYGLKAGSDQRHLVSYHSSGGHSSSEYFHAQGLAGLQHGPVAPPVAGRQLPTDRRGLRPDPSQAHPGHGVPLRGPSGRASHRHRQGVRGRAGPGRAHRRVRCPRRVPTGRCSRVLRATATATTTSTRWPTLDGSTAPGTTPIPILPPRADWFVSIDAPGASGMGHLRRLVEIAAVACGRA